MKKPKIDDLKGWEQFLKIKQIERLGIQISNEGKVSIKDALTLDRFSLMGDFIYWRNRTSERKKDTPPEVLRQDNEGLKGLHDRIADHFRTAVLLILKSETEEACEVQEDLTAFAKVLAKRSKLKKYDARIWISNALVFFFNTKKRWPSTSELRNYLVSCRFHVTSSNLDKTLDEMGVREFISKDKPGPK